MRAVQMLSERGVALKFLNQQIIDDYTACVGDLIAHPLVCSMDRYIHHSQVTCLEHCLSVSFHSFQVCRRFGLDFVSAARSGLLHDFYLYDWHIQHPVPGLHGFTHPRTALQNARRYFALNSREANAIERHMWPLTFRPPRGRIAWAICLVDKYCAIVEVLRLSSWRHLHALKYRQAE